MIAVTTVASLITLLCLWGPGKGKLEWNKTVMGWREC